MGISVQALRSQYFRASSLGNADLANELLTEIRKIDPTFLVEPPGPVQVFTEYYNPGSARRNSGSSSHYEIHGGVWDILDVDLRSRRYNRPRNILVG